MKNSDFDYSWHYGHWHSDTQDSKKRDIAYAKYIFETQSIYPPPPRNISADSISSKEERYSSKVLEIGCGMGRFLLHLKEVGYHNLVGIDIDKSQYEIAKKEGLQVFLCDANNFLSNNQTIYDCVYAFDVLEHIEKSQQLNLLRLIFDNLSDDGMLVLQVPNALAPSASYYRYIDFTHNISFTEHSLGFLLHNAGFHDFCIQATHHETLEIQNLKLTWAKIYRHELGLKNLILTPNMMAIAFKSKRAYQHWIQNSTPICNSYDHSWQMLLAYRFTTWRNYIKAKRRKMNNMVKTILQKP